MKRLKLYVSIPVAVVIGILLQIILVWADGKDTPGKAAVQFSKAYYQLDPSMREYLCAKTLDAAGGNAVENYIRQISTEAENRGLDVNYMRHILYNIETHTHRKDDVTAEVIITAKRRVSINPVYALIAKFFQIGETHKVNEPLTAVRENGRWKICGNPFSLIL